MKLLTIFILLLLAGCQSTKVCDTDPSLKVCNSDTYSYEVRSALTDFDSYDSKKAFALAIDKSGNQVFGYAYGYEFKKQANKQAL